MPKLHLLIQHFFPQKKNAAEHKQIICWNILNVKPECDIKEVLTEHTKGVKVPAPAGQDDQTRKNLKPGGTWGLQAVT